MDAGADTLSPVCHLKRQPAVLGPVSDPWEERLSHLLQGSRSHMRTAGAPLWSLWDHSQRISGWTIAVLCRPRYGSGSPFWLELFPKVCTWKPAHVELEPRSGVDLPRGLCKRNCGWSCFSPLGRAPWFTQERASGVCGCPGLTAKGAEPPGRGRSPPRLFPRTPAFLESGFTTGSVLPFFQIEIFSMRRKKPLYALVQCRI